MNNYIKSIEFDGNMVIVKRRIGYTKMPLKKSISLRSNVVCTTFNV